MTRVASLLLGLGIATAALGPIAGSRVLAQRADQIKGSKPLVGWSGARSGVDDKQILRITSAQQWADVWSRHVGEKLEKNRFGQAQAPEIDFDVCMVVAIFEGRTWNSDGLRLEPITEDDDHILLRFGHLSYQTFGPDGGGVRVTPFGIYVLPRSAKPLVVEKDTNNLIGKPPVWTQIVRFEKL